MLIHMCLNHANDCLNVSLSLTVWLEISAGDFTGIWQKFVCAAVHVCVTICWSGSWVSTDCTFRPIYMLSGADHSFLWRGGGLWLFWITCPQRLFMGKMGQLASSYDVAWNNVVVTPPRGKRGKLPQSKVCSRLHYWYIYQNDVFFVNIWWKDHTIWQHGLLYFKIGHIYIYEIN